METVTIKINNSLALKLLEDLEALNLIQVIKKSVSKEKSKKLSERLAGSITPKQAEIMRKELAQMRNQWERDLIDTNIVIDFSENRLTPKAKVFVGSIIDNNPVLSIINKIELLSFSTVNTVIKELVDISTRTISIRKTKQVKLPDAVIAATAIENHPILVTRNASDFKSIEGLALINPWES